MAKTDPINVANPAGSSDPKQGDDFIRTLARAVIEMLSEDHYVGTPTSNAYDEDDAGQHSKVTLKDTQTSSSVGNSTIYAEDQTGDEDLAYKNANGHTAYITEEYLSALKLRLDNGVLSNDTALKAKNAAGDGYNDLIKASGDDVVYVPDGTRVAATCESGDNTLTLANMGYVDAQIAAEVIARSFGTWTVKDSGGSDDLVKDEIYKVGSDGFVIAYSNATSGVGIKGYTSSSSSPTQKFANSGEASDPAGITMPIKKDDYWKVTIASGDVTINWLPIGTGTCVKQ